MLTLTYLYGSGLRAHAPMAAPCAGFDPGGVCVAGERRHVPGATGAAAGLTSAAVAHAHEGSCAAVQGQGRIGRWNGNPM
jgi:hypothetical protein